MALAIVNTHVDPNRPNLVYKLEFESDEVMQNWLEFRPLEEARRDVWANDLQPNTMIVLWKDAGTHDLRKLKITFTTLVQILQYADQMQRVNDRGGSGRRPNRVLIATTSKERRLGQSQGY